VDVESFVQEIIQNPADDDLRLVFADFLEEQGDHRAELIRSMFELDGMSLFDKRRTKLRNRAKTLIKKHGAFGSVPKGVKILEYRGGFPHSIEVTVARFLKLHELIFQFAPVRSVVLKSESKSFGQLCDVSYLSNLSHLTLRNNNATAKDLTNLLTHDRLNSLESLSVLSNVNLTASVVTSMMKSPNLSSLQELTLQGYQLGPESSFAVSESTTLNNLKALRLSAVSDDALVAFARKDDFASLEELEVQGPISSRAVQAIQNRGSFPELTTLSIQSYEPSGSIAFDVANPLPKLKHVTIGEQFPSQILTDIVKNYPELETLNLTRNAIGNDAAIALASSPLLKNLDKLVLTANQIGFDGALAIAESQFRRKQTKLYLRSNPIPYDRVRELKERFGRTFGNLGDEKWNFSYPGGEADRWQSIIRGE